MTKKHIITLQVIQTDIPAHPDTLQTIGKAYTRAFLDIDKVLDLAQSIIISGAYRRIQQQTIEAKIEQLQDELKKLAA